MVDCTGVKPCDLMKDLEMLGVGDADEWCAIRGSG